MHTTMCCIYAHSVHMDTIPIGCVQFMRHQREYLHHTHRRRSSNDVVFSFWTENTKKTEKNTPFAIAFNAIFTAVIYIRYECSTTCRQGTPKKKKKRKRSETIAKHGEANEQVKKKMVLNNRTQLDGYGRWANNLRTSNAIHTIRIWFGSVNVYPSYK